MSARACDAYLESLVRTATPQRLRLMLIDGALRFARQALENWDRQEGQADAYESIVRCRAIVMELYGAIRKDASPVAKQVAALYLYLFRLLADVPSSRDRQKLCVVIDVLKEERETWSQLCRQMPEPPQAAAGEQAADREITVDAQAVDPPESPGIELDA
jgi:flagellar protein FliS